MHYPHRYKKRECNELFRAVVSMDGYLHPSGAAVSNAAWRLEETTFTKRIPLSRGIWAYLFKGDQGTVDPSMDQGLSGRSEYSVAVIMNSSGSPISVPSLPVEAAVVDLFGNPVDEKPSMENTMLYVMLKGDVRRLEYALRKWSREVSVSK